MQDLDLIKQMLKQKQFVFKFEINEKHQILLFGNKKYYGVECEIDAERNFADFYFRSIHDLKNWIEKEYQISFDTIIQRMIESTYVLAGYDKDNDLYSPIRFFTSKEEAVSWGIGDYERYSNGYILRNELGEPFDWFEVIHTRDYDTSNYEPLWTSYEYEKEQETTQNYALLS